MSIASSVSNRCTTFQRGNSENTADKLRVNRGCPFPNEGVHDRTTLTNAGRSCLDSRGRYLHLVYNCESIILAGFPTKGSLINLNLSGQPVSVPPPDHRNVHGQVDCGIRSQGAERISVTDNPFANPSQIHCNWSQNCHYGFFRFESAMIFSRGGTNGRHVWSSPAVEEGTC